MSRTNFENLRVDRLSDNLADLIWDTIKAMARSGPRHRGQVTRAGGGQYRRECCSGYGARQLPEQPSLRAGGPWLALPNSPRRKLLTRKENESLKPSIDALSPLLNAYLRSIGSGPKNTQR